MAYAMGYFDQSDTFVLHAQATDHQTLTKMDKSAVKTQSMTNAA